MRPLSLILAIVCWLPLQSLAELPQELTFGGTDWCPYTCANGRDDHGIVAKYLTWIFAQEGIELRTRIMTWSRAIREADSGNLDGLLTAVPGEAPKLKLTTTPTMSYQDCFYTRPADKWQYQGVASLKGRRLGAIQDYGYSPELDQYIDQGEGVLLISGDNLPARLHSMLALGRIDVFISDKRVHKNAERKSPKPLSAIQRSSCLPETPFFLAVQPDKAWSDEVLALLNRVLATDAAKRKLAEIEAVSLRGNSKQSAPTRKPKLSPGFVTDNGDSVGQVHTTVGFAHGNAQAIQWIKAVHHRHR